MKPLIRSVLASAVLCAASLGSAQAAPTFAITGASTAAMGSTFSLAVTATDMADLYGWQFDITFNPVLFRAAGVTEGPFLTAGGTTFFDGGSIDNAHGTISFVFDSLLGAGPGVNGSGVLARLNFSTVANAPSIGTFGLANVTALNASLNTVAVGSSSLNVTVTPVPEPGSWALMGLGLAALVGWTARRRQATGA